MKEEQKIAQFYKENMRGPTLAVICKRFGYRSKATAQKKVRKLKELKLI